MSDVIHTGIGLSESAFRVISMDLPALIAARHRTATIARIKERRLARYLRRTLPVKTVVCYTRTFVVAVRRQ